MINPALVNLVSVRRLQQLVPGRTEDEINGLDELAILPNATHMVPFDQAASFNAVLGRFFRTPFVKKDALVTR
jgi:pimeloyl-ACP methyl ester carboxylesterase